LWKKPVLEVHKKDVVREKKNMGLGRKGKGIPFLFFFP